MGVDSNYILFSNHFPELHLPFDLESVGQKALGLSDLDCRLVPPYFVITSKLYKAWLLNKSLASKTLQNTLQKGIEVLDYEQKFFFIVRSSAKYESFDERGFYESSKGNIHSSDLHKFVLQIWEKNLVDIQKYEDNSFAVIVQQYQKPKLVGHLSNERRISRSKTEWLLEIADENGNFTTNTKFIAKNSKVNFEIDTFNCTKQKLVIAALKQFAFTQKERKHIEWVWDGSVIKLVQNDVEVNDIIGDKPGHIWPRSKEIIEAINLSCFTTVDNSTKNWRKVECLRTFIKCNLPFGQIYVLENSKIIDELGAENISPELLVDLKWLVLYPITIRMDVCNADGYNNILLPRTETIFNVEKAIDFLINNSKVFLAKGLSSQDFCFLIHRFIISNSCALAFSKPHLQKARIDSTWGIVEGLYFHPHDSFEVNLMNSTQKIKKQIRCKTEYIDVDNVGKWFSKKSGIDFDWAESLTKKQINSIAEYNIKISEHLNSPVTVMYFVGVDQSTGYPEVLPWFYTTDEITESSEKFTDVIFSEHRFVIENEDHFKKIQEDIKSDKPFKTTLKLKLNPDISRNKKLIEDIGNFANDKVLAIELDGSILSHTYYILRKLGVKVKCLDSFEPKYKKQEFHKLVRDKIPVNIELKGEKARTAKISSDDLLHFLKEKAIEEAYEFYFETKEDKIVEELADIYEIIRTTCKVFGIPVDNVIKIADSKNEKKGGFESGIVLLNTEESSLIDIIDASGNSLLINEEEKQIVGRMKKKRKIAFGSDNSMTLPYINNFESSSQKDLFATVDLQEVKSLQVSYTPKGIKVTFIKKNENNPENNQLSLF